MSNDFLRGWDDMDAALRGREAGQANRAIHELNARVRKAEPLAIDYQNWLKNKRVEGPDQAYFEIFAEMRPDLFDAQKATLVQKQSFNLRMLAWVEWWAEAIRGHGQLAKERVPKLRGLSDSLNRGEISARAAARAVADMADRLELAKGMDDPREWVKNREAEMWKKVKFHKNAPAVPIFSSVRPHTPALEKRAKEGTFPENVYGIDDMMQQ